MPPYPPLHLSHLKRLTDNTGTIQHGLFSTPNPHTGYSIDDVSRALIVALKHHQLTRDQESLELAYTYLKFIHYAQRTDGKFHNFLSFDRKWLDVEASEDAFGRTLWSLGYTIQTLPEAGLGLSAKTLFDRAFPWIKELTANRAWAFSMIGLYHYHLAYPEKAPVLEQLDTLTQNLIENFKAHATDDWLWFEDFLTYENGRLPMALFLSYDVTGQKTTLETATKSLDFLLSTLIVDDYMELIGHDGWYFKGKEKALFGQQPVDAGGMVEACLVAYRITRLEKYQKAAKMAFDWFFGKNTRGVMMYNPETGGCYDGIGPTKVNRNQGAEATVSFLLAYLAVLEAVRQKEFPQRIVKTGRPLLTIK